MTYYVSENSKVDPLFYSVGFMAEIANATACVIFLVKRPVRFALYSILPKISGLLRYMADKSARGSYHVLSRIVNNGLTRRISPSVSLWDDKIENACSTGGRWAGNALVFPFTVAFYLIATAYASAVSLIAALIFCVCTYLRFALLLLPVQAVRMVSDRVFLATKKDAECCKNTPSKALYMAYLLAWRFSLWAIIHPTLKLCIYTLHRAFSLVPMCFFIPVHMLSSILGLDNKFNIYNYESGMGIVHNYIQDLLALHHGGGPLIPAYMKNILINEATKGDLDITNAVSMDETLAILDDAMLEQYTQQQHMASA